MDFDQRLELLRARYLASLPSKREHLVKAWSALRAAPADAGARSELRTLLHRLAGSAPAYGQAELGERAADASRRIGDADADAVDLVNDLVEPVGRILALLESDPAVASASATQVAEDAVPLRVILVEDDAEQAERIGVALAARGCTVRHAQHSESLWQVVTTWPCDAILIDYWLGDETALDIVAMVRGEPSFAPIALVCLTVESDAHILAGVTGRGCDAVFSKRHDAGAIVDALHVHVRRRRAMR